MQLAFGASYPSFDGKLRTTSLGVLFLQVEGMRFCPIYIIEIDMHLWGWD